MMFKTHVALAVAVGLAVVPHVTHPYSFFPLLILATLLPDIDSMHSFLGQYKLFRPLQWFVSHRGMIHSMTLCLAITFLLALFVPVVALPFFVGYGLHLFADSVTIEGIRLWWPWSDEVRGKIRTNGRVEKIIFYALCFVIVVLVVRLVR